MGDLPTMVVEAEVVEAGNHRTTTMAGVAEGAKSPSTPLTCLAERSLVAAEVEVASLSIPLDCSEEKNQVAVEETETDRDLLMESQDPVEVEEAGQNQPMELVVAVGASFLVSAFLT